MAYRSTHLRPKKPRFCAETLYTVFPRVKLYLRDDRSLLVSQKPLLDIYCFFLWVSFKVFLIFCVTSFDDRTQPQHKETTIWWCQSFPLCFVFQINQSHWGYWVFIKLKRLWFVWQCCMPNRFLWDEVVVNFFIGFENLCSPCCLVPVGRLPSPSRSINSTDEGSGARFSKVPVTLRARNQIFQSKYKE